MRRVRRAAALAWVALLLRESRLPLLRAAAGETMNLPAILDALHAEYDGVRTQIDGAAGLISESLASMGALAAYYGAPMPKPDPIEPWPIWSVYAETRVFTFDGAAKRCGP